MPQIMDRLHTETWREALARQRDARAVARFDQLVAEGMADDVAAFHAALSA